MPNLRWINLLKIASGYHGDRPFSHTAHEPSLHIYPIPTTANQRAFPFLSLRMPAKYEIKLRPDP